ncbi:hypothetical protein JW777_00270, partial [bacterium]|nr:hypothetical protein [bacterium]
GVPGSGFRVPSQKKNQNEGWGRHPRIPLSGIQGGEGDPVMDYQKGQKGQQDLTGLFVINMRPDARQKNSGMTPPYYFNEL